MGRDPSEILRLAAGLYYTERRDLITALYTLFRVCVSLVHPILLAPLVVSWPLFFLMNSLTVAAGCCAGSGSWCWYSIGCSEISRRSYQFWAQTALNFSYKGLDLNNVFFHIMPTQMCSYAFQCKHVPLVLLVF